MGSALDEIRQAVTVTRKGGDVQEVPIGSLATEYLATYTREIRPLLHPKGSYLWVNDKGGKMQDYTYRIILKRHLQTLKLGRFTSHSFRHAAGTHMMQKGAPIHAIQHFLGHKTVDSTAVYTRVDPGKIREAVEGVVLKGQF